MTNADSPTTALQEVLRLLTLSRQTIQIAESQLYLHRQREFEENVTHDT